jgi:hypothetical protein
VGLCHTGAYNYSWDREGKNNEKNNPRNTNEQQLFLETQNRKFRSNWKPNTSRAEEGYCNEAIQSGPSTHSQSHQALNIFKNTEVKQSMAWTREGIREIMWCSM